MNVIWPIVIEKVEESHMMLTIHRSATHTHIQTNIVHPNEINCHFDVNSPENFERSMSPSYCQANADSLKHYTLHISNSILLPSHFGWG